jgi:ribose transport system substrate-binding protein
LVLTLPQTQPPSLLFCRPDNEKGGRVAADGLAAAIQAKYGKAEGDVALINFLPGVGSLQARDKGFKEQLAVDTGVTLITKENMDTPRSQELLNPQLK